MATTKRVMIGQVECPTCKADGRTRLARVATNVKGNLFYACDGDEEYAGCGINHMGYRGGQAWLRKNTVFKPGFEHFKNSDQDAMPMPVVERVKPVQKTPVPVKEEVVVVAAVNEPVNVETSVKKISWLDREIF